MKDRISSFAIGLVAVLIFAHRPLNAQFLTNDPAYLKPLAPDVKITPLLTVGEGLPRTSNAAQAFRLVGIPDGLGWIKTPDGKVRLWVNHEISKKTVSQPVAGGSFQQGAFVSEYLMSLQPLGFLSGDLAATTIFQGAGNTPVSGVISNLCSGFLADERVGFDRPIYLTGEEDHGEDTFDGRGGQAFAFVNGTAFVLPDFGRFQKENLVVLPNTGLKTVVFGMEDGPHGLNSQLYLYIGQKNLSSTQPLERNGLVGGRLYAFASTKIEKTDESNFTKSDHALIGRWIPIPEAARWNDADLDERTRGNGSFNFDRIEDGTYDRNRPGVFYFVTTGGDIPANRKGRLYRLTIDPNDPLGKPTLLEILLAGDAGDPIVSPDNIDANAGDWMAITEDFTIANQQTRFSRQPSLWLYNLGSGSLRRVAELNPEAADGKAPTALSVFGDILMGHAWEPSGVIDVSDLFGLGSWMLDVQAHDIDSRRASAMQNLSSDGYLVQGGQILLLTTSLGAGH